MSEIPQLRPYQKATVALARKAFMKHKHVLLISAQASGKTYMFSSMALSSLGMGYRVMIVSNRAKLLRQAGGALTRFGINAEYISAKHRTIPTGNCIVATAQTLQRRFDLPEYQELYKSVDFWMFDEAHVNDFNFLFESGLLDNVWVLGVTATAARVGKMRQMGLDYDVMVEGLSVKDGVNLGFLVPAKHYTLDAPDLSSVGIDTIRGDYNTKDLYKVFSTPKVYGGLISEFKKLCNNEKSICFCSNQVHAIKTCVELNNAGISAKFIISGLKKDDEDFNLFEDNKRLTGKKEDIEDEFARGLFTVLVNVAVYVAGFDEPSIRNVIFLRATLSSVLWDQAAGRGSRLYENKPFFRILDFGGNVARHGLYERDRVNALWHDTKEGGGVALSKECPPLEKDKEGKHGCGRLIHISYPVCPFKDCGYIFKTPEEIRDIELREIIGGEFKFKDMTATQLKAYAELNHYSARWMWRQLWIGNEEKDFRRGLRELGYQNNFIYRQMMIFKEEDAKRKKAALIKEQNKLQK